MIWASLRRQCEAHSRAGFFWQHWRFSCGVPCQLFANLLSPPRDGARSRR